MNSSRLPAIALVGLFVAIVGLMWPVVAFGDDSLFDPAPSLSSEQTTQLELNVARFRPAAINWNALSPATREIRLNLFDDVVLTAERLRIDRSVIDGYVWVGRVMGVPDSLVTLSVQGDVLVGSIWLNGYERYTVSPAIGGSAAANGLPVHLIEEIDPRRIREPNGVDAIVPPLPLSNDPTDQVQAATCEDGKVIDLLVAYTADARDWIGGDENMELWINARISEMNSANIDSQAPFRWQLVGVQAVDYVPSDSLKTDLTRLQSPDDGYLDAVHMERFTKKADLVNLLVASGNNGACGLAYQLELVNGEPHPGFAGWAFGITALDYGGDYSCSTLTLAHEIGHTMGNAHNYENAGSTAVKPYAYGYQDPGQQFRTIMSYDCPGGCERINRWSNPNTTYLGLPVGIHESAGLGYSTDTARSMTEWSTTVANFQPNCAETPTPPDPTVEPTATATPFPPEPSATPTTAPTTAPTPVPPSTPAPTATRSILPAVVYRTMLPVVLNSQ